MDPMMPDRIVLYDGDIYNYTTDVFAEIHMNSNNLMKFFKTEGTSISVELHATGASGDLGFVAEVVTLPISNLGISRCHEFVFNMSMGIIMCYLYILFDLLMVIAKILLISILYCLYNAHIYFVLGFF